MNKDERDYTDVGEAEYDEATRRALHNEERRNHETWYGVLCDVEDGLGVESER